MGDTASAPTAAAQDGAPSSAVENGQALRTMHPHKREAPSEVDDRSSSSVSEASQASSKKKATAVSENKERPKQNAFTVSPAQHPLTKTQLLPDQEDTTPKIRYSSELGHLRDGYDMVKPGEKRLNRCNTCHTEFLITPWKADYAYVEENGKEMQAVRCIWRTCPGLSYSTINK